MALTINTNMSSLITQNNLALATKQLNRAIERMTTGYKINSSADNAASYSIANTWEVQLSSLDVAADNAAMGADMLATAEDTYSIITDHLQRIRDLTEQAANGTYGSASLGAINKELEARFAEIDRIAADANFNGVKLMDGTAGDIKLQVGILSGENSQIKLASSLFADTDLAALQSIGNFSKNTAKELAQECSGYTPNSVPVHANAIAALTKIDKVITNISSRATNIGAARNRVDSAIEAISVQSENLTSSLSSLRDADIAEESSNYIKSQILQQASATLLSTANQTPSIALSLI